MEAALSVVLLLLVVETQTMTTALLLEGFVGCSQEKGTGAEAGGGQGGLP